MKSIYYFKPKFIMPGSTSCIKFQQRNIQYPAQLSPALIFKNFHRVLIPLYMYVHLLLFFTQEEPMLALTLCSITRFLKYNSNDLSLIYFDFDLVSCPCYRLQCKSLGTAWDLLWCLISGMGSFLVFYHNNQHSHPYFTLSKSF